MPTQYYLYLLSLNQAAPAKKAKAKKPRWDKNDPRGKRPSPLQSAAATGKSEFVLFCCVLWCVQYEDSAFRILHLNLVCLDLIAFASRMY